MKLSYGVFIASLILIGCGSSNNDDKNSEVQKPKNYTLVVAETTDMHGQIFPYDFINGVEQNQSLAHISTYSKAKQAQDDTNSSMGFILVDNGDLLQGQPIVNLYNNKDLTKENHIYVDVMNYLKYDTAIVGNHDVEPGHDVYDNMLKQSKFPWLAANAVKEGTNEPYFQAYSIIERDGVKIAILGLTTPGVPNWLPNEVYSGIEYKDMVESASYWVNEIKTKENPDVLIGLFHSGFDYAYGGYSKEDSLNPNAVQLIAQEVEGFDVIFFGHDHSPRITTVNNVPILGGGSYANIISEAKINLVWNEEKESYDVNVSMENIKSGKFAVDNDFLTRFDYAKKETIDFVTSPVGTFTAPVNSKDAMFKDSAFNDLVHELEFYVAKEKLNMPIDFSIAAPLQYDVSIEAGDVQFGDMWKLYKYDNLYYIMELTGQEIKDYLEYSYSVWMNVMKDENDDLIAFYIKEDGTRDTVTRYYNYDSIAGLVYDVNVSKDKDRIIIKGIDKDLDGEVDEDSQFDLTTKYKVGINSYRGGGGGGHLEGAGLTTQEIEEETRILTKSETGLREYLLSWIQEQRTFTPRAIGNWKVIPQDWALKGENKSKAELYGNDNSH